MSHFLATCWKCLEKAMMEKECLRKFECDCLIILPISAYKFMPSKTKKTKITIAEFEFQFQECGCGWKNISQFTMKKFSGRRISSSLELIYLNLSDHTVRKFLMLNFRVHREMWPFISQILQMMVDLSFGILYNRRLRTHK